MLQNPDYGKLQMFVFLQQGEEMHLHKVWDNLRSNLWFRPVLWTVTLALLALGLVNFDRSLAPSFQPLASLSWYFAGDAAGARTILGSIATSMLTVTTLAFSIMMVAVVQTANAYSPRLLPQYLSDSANQHVLGILIGTFLYAILVLRAVRSTAELQFVPLLATNVAVLLAMIATGAFIFFINHASHSISVSNIILLISSATDELIEKNAIFPENVGEPWRGAKPPPLPPTSPAILCAEVGGYIDLIEVVPLLDAAVDAHAVVRLECAIGDYILPGQPLVTVWPATACDDKLSATLHDVIHTGNERSLIQDLRFGIHQLSDVAVRALSPGINDPTTAVYCIDSLALLITHWMNRERVSPYRCYQGELRVIAPTPTFADLLDSAYAQIRYYGSGDMETTLRLLEVYAQIGSLSTEVGEKAILWEHVERLLETAAQHITGAGDRARLNRQLAITAKTFSQDAYPLMLEIGERQSSLSSV